MTKFIPDPNRLQKKNHFVISPRSGQYKYADSTKDPKAVAKKKAFDIYEEKMLKAQEKDDIFNHGDDNG